MVLNWDLCSVFDNGLCASMQDLDNLYNYLHQLESCRRLREAALRHLCKVARYESYPDNSVVYKWDLIVLLELEGTQKSTYLCQGDSHL